MDATPHATPPLSLPALVESLLFVAPGPATLDQLAQAAETTPDAIEAALDELTVALAGRGLRLQRLGGRVRLTTAPDAAAAVQRFLGLGQDPPLSPAVLETMAIIAYRQPITRPEIEAVRGVSADHAVRTLLARGLIEEVGRAESVGRPFLYAPTARFLEHFGLPDLDSLPPLEETTDH
ncbi:MAG: SMC-Scp complex subunit ScpB [Anaerolineae bacterium]|nr:SMC-Scp complex subunit ScpB [Anaerolineae bacterium]